MRRLTPKNDAERVTARRAQVLAGRELQRAMQRKAWSMMHLAVEMNLTGTASLERIFAGENTSVSWLARAASALGCDLQIRFVEKSS